MKSRICPVDPGCHTDSCPGHDPVFLYGHSGISTDLQIFYQSIHISICHHLSQFIILMGTYSKVIAVLDKCLFASGFLFIICRIIDEGRSLSMFIHDRYCSRIPDPETEASLWACMIRDQYTASHGCQSLHEFPVCLIILQEESRNRCICLQVIQIHDPVVLCDPVQNVCKTQVCPCYCKFTFNNIQVNCAGLPLC